MSEWKKVKFLDYIELNPKVLINKGEVCPFIEMANVDCNMRQPRSFEYKPFTSGVKFQTYDTVIARIEPCLQNGKGFLFTKQGVGFGSTEYLVFRAKPSKTIPLFVYYFMRTHKIKTLMCNSMSGATGRQRVNNDVFLNLEVDIPSYDEQQRIATILSRYDSLIENYQKQIKLLEESAQRLYKEWFIDLRFPGHENTKIVDGVPEGWEKGVLDDIAYESGKKIDKSNRDKFEYYLPIDCLPKHSLTYLTPADISLAESSLVSFEENDILFGAMRPYFHKVCYAQSKGLTRSTCFVLNSKEKEYREFLLMLLFDDCSVKHATSISVGTTMPYTRWKDFKSMNIIIPPKDIAISFSQNLSQIINALKNLSFQIHDLTEVRNRLLPMLMS
jgi:type I restriction enzyme S subunit